MRGVRGDEEMTATNGLAGRGFLFVVEDGCIFKHCANKHRENRSWKSDLGVPAHGCGMHAAPEDITYVPQCLENPHL